MKENVKEINLDIHNHYNDLPYKSSVHLYTAPQRIAAVAALYGLENPPLENARILELGCSFGANSIPTAIYYPQSKIVGVDLSVKQIEFAQKAAEFIQLDNITFLQKDICEITAEFGVFDYIICHGVYSWVPQEVQKAIRRVCRECLAPNGLALISYNTYPGWKGKEILRDIMRYSAGNILEEVTKVEYGVSFLEFLKKNTNTNLVKTVLDSHFDRINSASKSYISHEYFEKFNSPQYFHEFIKEIQEDGLTFVAESNLNGVISPLGDEADKIISNECAGDWVKYQQYFDYVANTTFRSSILCHKELEEQIMRSKNIKYTSLEKVHVSGKFLYDQEKACYRSVETGNFVGSQQPKFIEAINNAFPATLSVKEFMDNYKQTLSEDERSDKLAAMYFYVAQVIFSNILDVTIKPIKSVEYSLQYPKINEKIRLLAEFLVIEGTRNISMFTSLYKTYNKEEPMLPYILSKLDGKHTKKEIVEFVLGVVERKEVLFHVNNNVLTDMNDIIKSSENLVDTIISDMQFYGMLE